MQQLYNDIVTLITGLPTIVPASISAFIALVGFYFTMKYARGPRLRVTIFGDKVLDHVCFLLPFADNTVFAIPIRINIGNKGFKTAKNINVVVEAPDNFYHHEIERGMNKISVARKVQIAADVATGKQVATAYYAIPEIHRDNSYALTDFIFASDDTIMRDVVNTTTKSGAPVKIPYTILYSALLKVSIAAEDILPIIFTYSISFRRGDESEINAAINRENEIIYEVISKNGKIDEENATLITFGKFTKKPVDGTALIILEADSSSMLGRNARITPQGLKPLKSFAYWKAERRSSKRSFVRSR